MKIKQHPGTGLWVSSDGRVIMPPSPKYPKFRFTYGYKAKSGYMMVQFRGKKYSVHRLIAGAFLENRLNLPTVDHIDRNPSNNRVDNLRWADRKTQQNNRQVCEDSLAKYGVRRCEDSAGYQRALYENNPEKYRAYKRALYENNPEKYRAYKRALRANNPEYALKQREKCREWEAKQRALGKRQRTCPDGSRHWLTDEEFNERYKDGLK